MGTKIVQPGTRQTPPNPDRSRSRGLGDAVEVVAKPVARALGLPEDCAPCQRRKERLNAISDRAAARIRQVFRRRTP